MLDSHLESLYQQAQAAIKARDYEYACELLKRILVVDEDYKDTSRLLARAVRLRKRRWYNHPPLWGAFGAVAIFILGFVIAPWIGGIGANPAPAPTASATATDTENPTSTSTATPTRTSRPTSTATPPPVWVIDFAQPILSTIANSPPTLQDDFHDNSGGWYPGHHDNSYQFQFVDNELIFGDCSANRSKMAYTDFVLELDIRIYSNSHLSIYYRNLYEFLIQQDGRLEVWPLPWTKESPIDIPGEVYRPNHVLLIAKGNRYAFYVNNKPIYYLEDSHFFTREAIFFLARGKVALDNLKIWDLEKVSNPP